MIKTWLITTSAPFCGTDQFYSDFSETDPCEIQSVNDWFWDEETQNLWDSYSFYNDSEYDEEFEGSGRNDLGTFMDEKFQEWQEDCNITSCEMSIEDLKDYGYNGEIPDIIYDERK